MKRNSLKFLSQFFALFLLYSILCVTAFADGQRIYDNAGLFSESEISILEDSIQQAIQETNVDFAVFTTNGTDGKEIRVFTADMTEEYGVGQGENRDLIALGIDMGERATATIVHGSIEDYLPVDSTNYINDVVLDYMRAGDYYGAALAFIDTGKEGILNYDASSGDVYDYAESPTYDPDIGYAGHKEPFPITISLLIGLIIGGISIAVLWMMHPRTIGKSFGTESYLNYGRDGGIYLTRQKDIFVSTHTARVAKPKDNDNNNGGGSSGGSFSSSSGGSYSGSSGKF